MIKKIKGLNLEKMKVAPIGFSGDAVYLLEEGYQGKDVVVKISSRDEVRFEGENLQWLFNQVRVPKIYEIGKIENQNYLIMEKLPGRMLQEAFVDWKVEDVICEYARAIRRFHEIPLGKIPHNHGVEQKIQEAKENIDKKVVKTQYFEPEFQNMSALEVYQLMLQYRPKEEDIVISHGDVCMPNMILNENAEIGYIDVVQMGTNDRHLDIAIGLRSLRYNLALYSYELTKEYIDLFKKAYGIEKLDRDKIMFYILLDELTNG